jgi:predicted small secreted protein
MTYGDGSVVRGPFGYEDVTVAGLTAKKQQISLANKISFDGGRVVSGLMGLAYPIVTSAYNTSSSTGRDIDSPGHRVYDPLFTTMYKQGITAPVFSVVVDGRKGTGWLAFGGIPPVDYIPEFVSTPIKKVNRPRTLSTG